MPDLLHVQPLQKPPENRRVILLLALALLFLIMSATVGGILFASSAGIKPGTVWARLRTLSLSREKMLQGERNDRINILLLGMGGPGHDGATLTDTILIASVRPSDGVVGLLSIPRDLQVNIPSYGYRRINSVNAYAEDEKKDSGGAASSAFIATLIGQPLPYFVRVDFNAFKEIVDTVGGLEVQVDQAFYDAFYPNNNYGYAPVAFEAGKQHMNGERALQFVRSRHGTNGEGNDFARARRQQKILLALKERLLSFDILLRPKRIQSILDTLTDHIQTNLAFWEGLRLAKLLRNIDSAKIINQVLDASPEGILAERNYNGAFVLEPKSSNWDAVRAMAAGLLDVSAAPSRSPPKSVMLNPEKRDGESRATIIPSTHTAPLRAIRDAASAPSASIEIQNGTFTVGLAAKIAAQLEAQGFNPASIGNASLRNVQTTIVYDLTNGQRVADFEKLKTTLQAIPGEDEPLHLISQNKLDFVVILGKNAMP